MITVLIADNDGKIQEIISQMLNKAGNANIDIVKQEDIIKIVNKSEIKELVTLKDKIAEMGDALYEEKKGELYRVILEGVERPLIEYVLERTEGNQLKAARILGMNRNTIRAKIKRLEINVDKWKVI